MIVKLINNRVIFDNVQEYEEIEVTTSNRIAVFYQNKNKYIGSWLNNLRIGDNYIIFETFLIRKTIIDKNSKLYELILDNEEKYNQIKTIISNYSSNFIETKSPFEIIMDEILEKISTEISIAEKFDIGLEKTSFADYCTSNKILINEEISNTLQKNLLQINELIITDNYAKKIEIITQKLIDLEIRLKQSKVTYTLAKKLLNDYLAYFTEYEQKYQQQKSKKNSIEEIEIILSAMNSKYNSLIDFFADELDSNLFDWDDYLKIENDYRLIIEKYDNFIEDLTIDHERVIENIEYEKKQREYDLRVLAQLKSFNPNIQTQLTRISELFNEHNHEDRNKQEIEESIIRILNSKPEIGVDDPLSQVFLLNEGQNLKLDLGIVSCPFCLKKNVQEKHISNCEQEVKKFNEVGQ